MGTERQVKAVPITAYPFLPEGAHRREAVAKQRSAFAKAFRPLISVHLFLREGAHQREAMAKPVEQTPQDASSLPGRAGEEWVRPTLGANCCLRPMTGKQPHRVG